MPTSSADFRLERFLPYLVHRVGTRFEEGYGERFDWSGVSLQEWRVLSVLTEAGALPMGEIAKRTSINASTLTRIIGQMEKRGLLARERPSGNQRTVYVRLLAEGRRKAEEIIPKIVEYERDLSACFSQAEIETLKSLLVRLYRSASDDDAPEQDRLAG